MTDEMVPIESERTRRILRVARVGYRRGRAPKWAVDLINAGPKDAAECAAMVELANRIGPVNRAAIWTMATLAARESNGDAAAMAEAIHGAVADAARRPETRRAR